MSFDMFRGNASRASSTASSNRRRLDYDNDDVGYFFLDDVDYLGAPSTIYGNRNNTTSKRKSTNQINGRQSQGKSNTSAATSTATSTRARAATTPAATTAAARAAATTTTTTPSSSVQVVQSTATSRSFREIIDDYDYAKKRKKEAMGIKKMIPQSSKAQHEPSIIEDIEFYDEVIKRVKAELNRK